MCLCKIKIFGISWDSQHIKRLVWQSVKRKRPKIYVCHINSKCAFMPLNFNKAQPNTIYSNARIYYDLNLKMNGSCCENLICYVCCGSYSFHMLLISIVTYVLRHLQCINISNAVQWRNSKLFEWIFFFKPNQRHGWLKFYRGKWC